MMSGYDRHSLLLTAIFVLSVLVIMILLVGTVLESALIIALYLYGSIPFGYIFLYLNRGGIPEDRGIIGVAKSFRLGGYRSGIPTAMGEISKAIIPLAISFFYYDLEMGITVSLVFSTYIGTNFSAFLGGKGGAGATIILWSTLVLSPISILANALLFIVSVRLTKDSYISTMHFFIQLPILFAIITRSPELTLFGIGVAMVFITRFSRERDEMKNLRPKDRNENGWNSGNQ